MCERKLSILQLRADARAPSGGSDDRSWGRRHILLGDGCAAMDAAVRGEMREPGTKGLGRIWRWRTGADGEVIGTGGEDDGDVILLCCVVLYVVFVPSGFRCSRVTAVTRC